MQQDPTALQRLADSAGLRVLSAAITTIALPCAGFVGVRVMDRLDRLDSALARFETQGATFELRMQAVERLIPVREAQLAKISEEQKQQNEAILELKLRVQQLQPRGR